MTSHFAHVLVVLVFPATHMSHFSRTLLSQGSHGYPTYTFMCIPHIHSITKTHSLTPILFLSAQLTGRVAALDAGEPRNSNGAPEKHLPVVTLSKPKPKFKVQLEVKVPHVMDAQKPHYIEYIWLKDEVSLLSHFSLHMSHSRCSSMFVDSS